MLITELLSGSFKVAEDSRLSFGGRSFALPAIESLFGNVVLADYIRSSFSALMLFQNPDNLRFCESCFHVNHVLVFYYMIS